MVGRKQQQGARQGEDLVSALAPALGGDSRPRPSVTLREHKAGRRPRPGAGGRTAPALLSCTSPAPVARCACGSRPGRAGSAQSSLPRGRRAGRGQWLAKTLAASCRCSGRRLPSARPPRREFCLRTQWSIFVLSYFFLLILYLKTYIAFFLTMIDFNLTGLKSPMSLVSAWRVNEEEGGGPQAPAPCVRAAGCCVCIRVQAPGGSSPGSWGGQWKNLQRTHLIMGCPSKKESLCSVMSCRLPLCPWLFFPESVLQLQ